MLRSLREAGIKSAKKSATAAEALEMVDLAGEQKKMPEAQAACASAWAWRGRSSAGPPVCFTTRPTTGLDPIATDSINRLIRRLQKRLAVTSVVVTHDMKTAFHTADQVAFLHEGRIYFDGQADELRTTTDRIMQDFIEGRSDDAD